MTFIDICAGIGGIRNGLEKAGHECIGYVEIDKFARNSYQAMYDTEDEWTATDITTVDPNDIPKADLWCFGFPCQDISLSGSQKGLEGERSGLFYSIINQIKSKNTEDRPKWLLIENVKNLLSLHEGGNLPRFSLKYPKQGMMQNGILSTQKIMAFPKTGKECLLSDVLEREVDPKYYLSQEKVNQLVEKHNLHNKHKTGRKSPSDK